MKRLGNAASWILLAALLGVPRPLGGQGLTFGTIEGAITDGTGGALPGVTVTLTSPVLQVPQLTTTTDASGNYRFPDLRVGVYRLQSELQGFQTLVRSGLDLSAGFVAHVDAVLEVGSVNETVTVSGVGPVVDRTTTRGGRTIPTQVLSAEIPMLGHATDVVKLTPGMSGFLGARGGNPGAMGVTATGAIQTYGQTGSTLLVEDFETHALTAPNNQTDTEQIDVKTYGNGADVQNAGVVQNMVFKSGGNDFHGMVGGQYMHDSMQASNLKDSDRENPVYRQLFRSPEALRYYADTHASLGGRIIRDSLWFFTSMRVRQNKRSLGGFALNAGPDGAFLTGDEPPAYPTANIISNVAKLSYQITPKYQLGGFFWSDFTLDNVGATNGVFGGATPVTVPFEASSIYDLNLFLGYGQFRGTPTNNLTFDVKFGHPDFTVRYLVQPGTENLPSSYDRTTQLYTGSAISTGETRSASRIGPTAFTLLTGSVTYIPGRSFAGSHLLKAGMRNSRVRIGSGALDHTAGNYLNIFDTVGGVPHQPVEMQTISLPVLAHFASNMPSIYGQDQWQVGRRITLNLGLRWDHQYVYIPEQTQEAGQFVARKSYPLIDVGTFSNLAPRVAVAWDLSGGGKTVVKGTYGSFTTELQPGGLGTSQFLQPLNPLVGTVTAYRWRDLNRNNNYDTGEVNLSLTGPDFISITGGVTNTRPLDPGFKVPVTREATVAVERELMPGMAARVLYVYKRLVNDWATLNVGRPYSAFNIALDRRDPGPDGVTGNADDGPMVTIYDYDPAYRGANFVVTQQVNKPGDRDNYAQTIVFSLEKRTVDRWSLAGSYNAIKQHRWIVAIPTSPNDEAYALDRTWTHTFRVNGNYTLPWDLQVGGNLVVLSGVPLQRTYIFRAADPLGGTPLRQLTTVTRRLEEFGERKAPVQPYLDMRIGKRITVGGKQLLLNVDIWNTLNTSVAQAVENASGPTFAQITQIPTPRALRLGAQFTF